MSGIFTRRKSPLSILCLFVLVSACDLPSSSPDFSFSTTGRAPIIFDKSYEFMGPGISGKEALIDTTGSAFNKLFSVDNSDRTIFIVQNLSDFNIGNLDDIIPSVNVNPIDVSVSIGGLADQTFSSSIAKKIDVFTLDPNDPGIPPLLFSELPVIPNPSGGTTDLTIPNFIVPPKVNLVSVNDPNVEAVRFTNETQAFNAFTVDLINDLTTETLTAASNVAQAPSITLLQNGVAVGTDSFGFVAPGTRASARISLAGKRVTKDDLTYRLDVGTASGVFPILSNPGIVRIKTTLDPLRYNETEVSSMPPQSNIDASSPEAILANNEVTFSGMIASSGQATINIDNSLPIPITMDQVDVQILDPVENFPVGSTIFSLSGQIVPASSSLEISINLGEVGISPRVSVTARASSTGSSGPVTLRADQGVAISLDGNVAIKKLLFEPSAQTFSKTGILNLDVNDVHFNTSADYVELESGSLEITDLINGLDLALDQVDVSLPGFRLAPYSPADTLVIRFAGTADNPSAHNFSKIERSSGPRNVTVDLSDVRVYPRGNQLTYHILARSESATSTRSISAFDRISASIRVNNAQIKSVSAILDPTSVAVTQDSDGDGRLDIFNDAEANVTSLDDLKDLSDQNIDGLTFSGSEFSFNVRTNISADMDLYAVLAGTKADGQQVFLTGRDEYAVAPSDSLVSSFLVGGAPADAGQMIHFILQGTPDPGQTITRTIVLNASNSTVDEFVSSLPQDIRYVGKAIVQPNGGQVTLSKPFELSASIGASIPLAIDGDFSFQKDVDADLTDLSDLTDPNKDVTVKGGTLRLTYENGIPLGLNARLEVLDNLGEVAVTFPGAGDADLLLDAAQTDAIGTASAARSGMVELALDESEVRQLSRGKQIRLVLGFQTDQNKTARMRADDTLNLSLLGDFSFDVKVGGN